MAIPNSVSFSILRLLKMSLNPFCAKLSVSTLGPASLGFFNSRIDGKKQKQ